MSVALVLGGLGWLLWWGGYYVALGTAWRAGVRGIGTVIAVGLGICGCSGIPILAMHYSRLQTVAFDAIGRGGDEVIAGARLRRYQVAMGIAVLGMIMQIAGGYLLPEDGDGVYDDPYGSYASDSYASDSYASDSYASDSYADDSPAHDDAADPVDDEAAPLDAVAEEPSEPVEEAVAPLGDTSRMLVLGVSADGRTAMVLPAGATRGRLVARTRRARFSVRPGATVSVEGEEPNGVLAATRVEDVGAPVWEGLPRPTVLRAPDLEDASAHSGEWVLIGGVTGIDATSVAVTDTLSLRVRAPRGAIAPGRVYTGLRGVIVDTRAFDRRGGVELWISRAEDVIAPAE